jgi:hypothetical protein
MNTIIFNEDKTFGLESYNKTTTFEGDTVNSSGYASLLMTQDTDTISDLVTVAQGTVTSIEIKHDGTSIYNSTNLNAKINNINEYLSGDRINVNINFIFNQGNNE